MTEKHFPCILFVNTGKKPTIEEIKEQLINQEPLISDKEAFERYLIRSGLVKWNDSML